MVHQTFFKMFSKSVAAKAFLAAFLLYLAVEVQSRTQQVPKAMQEHSAKIRKTCLKQSGAKNKDLRDVGERGFPNDVSHETKCYFHCLSEQLLQMGPDNKLSFDEIYRIITDDLVPVIDYGKVTCPNYNSSASDPCDEFYRVHTCFYHSTPKVYFII